MVVHDLVMFCFVDESMHANQFLVPVGIAACPMGCMFSIMHDLGTHDGLWLQS